MRGKLRILVGLLAWSGLVSTLVTGQDYVTLQWKPETGQTAKYTIKMSHLSAMGFD